MRRSAVVPVIAVLAAGCGSAGDRADTGRGAGGPRDFVGTCIDRWNAAPVRAGAPRKTVKVFLAGHGRVKAFVGTRDAVHGSLPTRPLPPSEKACQVTLRVQLRGNRRGTDSQWVEPAPGAGDF